MQMHKKEVEATKSLAVQSQNHLARLQFDLAFARVLLTSDQPEGPGRSWKKY
jgi:hypothetical protein